MAIYTHDGIEFDLSLTWLDVVGVEWRWTGGFNAAGEPLMTSGGGLPAVSLPDVYHDHGPLIPMPTPRVSIADWLRAPAAAGGVA